MITITEIKNKNEKNNEEYVLVELRGLSTDTKSNTIKLSKDGETIGTMKIDNGSEFIEIDTSKIYLFDLQNDQWKEV